MIPPFAFALLICVAAAPAAHAQRVTVLIGGGMVAFDEPMLSGTLPALTLGATLEPRRARMGVALTGRSALLVGGMAAIPSCVPGAVCLERRSPSVMVNAGVHGFARSDGDRLRLSAGAGWLQGSGGATGGETGSLALEGGVELRAISRRNIVPVLGLHVVHALRTASGVRTIVMPAIGVAF